MDIVISSSNVKYFDTFMQKIVKNNFVGIELDNVDITEQNLEILNMYRDKVRVVSIAGTIRNYKYQLFTAEAVACDFISFPVDSADDIYKLKKIAQEAADLGVNVAIKNSSKNNFYNSPINLSRTLEKVGIKKGGILLDTATAYVGNLSLTAFARGLRGKILGFHVSDVRENITGLPIGLGKTEYLNPLFSVFKGQKVPWIIKLNDHYNMQDILISIENLTESSKNYKFS